MIRRTPHHTGFTVVELGIVLGVITALMSVVVVQVQGYRTTVGYQALVAEMDNIAEAARHEYIRHRSAVAALDLSGAAITDPVRSGLPPNFQGRNPVTNQPYWVRIDETGGTEVLEGWRWKTKPAKKAGTKTIVSQSGWDTAPVVWVWTCLDSNWADAVSQNSWSLTAGAACGGSNRNVVLQKAVVPTGEGFHLMMLKADEEALGFN